MYTNEADGETGSTHTLKKYALRTPSSSNLREKPVPQARSDHTRLQVPALYDTCQLQRLSRPTDPFSATKTVMSQCSRMRQHQSLPVPRRCRGQGAHSLPSRCQISRLARSHSKRQQRLSSQQKRRRPARTLSRSLHTPQGW